MRRFFIFMLCFITSGAAHADTFSDKYVLSDAAVITTYMARNGLLNVEQDDHFLEFVRITDCNVFNMIQDSPFKQQEVRAALASQLPTEPVTNPQPLFIKIYTLFSLKGYNFETQSITLMPQSQINKANLFDVNNPETPPCGKRKTNVRNAVHNNYAVRLTYPISFFRIPMKQDMAENLLAQMDKRSSVSQTRVVYGTMYIQVEPIAPESQRWGATSRGIIRGQLDAIDIFLDFERTMLIKRFNFMDNY